jgi:uncharacterized protein DUF5752
MDCALTILSLGVSAQNLRELRDHLARVPVESLTHHFYDSLLRPEFDHPEYRNDFARWAQRGLHDALLAERLGVVDPMDHRNVEGLRAKLLDVLEDRLAEAEEVPQAPRGKEFHFLRSQFVIFDTGLMAPDPVRLAGMIPGLTTGSVFYHFIEARRRPPLEKDDFSVWLEPWGSDYEPVRERLAAVDYGMWSLIEIRERIARCFGPARAREGGT